MDVVSEFDKSYQSTRCNLDLERRFSCVVCLSPKFKMVHGLCQHKICTTCGYESNGALKMAFHRCPTCQREDVFPCVQPSIPEDNIVAQKLCGVRVCKYKGCGQEVWAWEKDSHELFCSYRVRTPKYHGRCSVKDCYSPITPKSSSRRRKIPGDISYTDSDEGYSLRSHEPSKQKTTSLERVHSPHTYRYNFRTRR